MGKTKKQIFTLGDELTEEERRAIGEFGQRKEAEMKERLEKVRPKEVGDFMNAPFAPFEDRVLVFPDPVEEKTAGGLYKPDVVIEKARPLIGTVVRFGPGKDKPLPLEEKMRIYYGNYAGTDIKIGEHKYLIMRMADIFGKVS